MVINYLLIAWLGNFNKKRTEPCIRLYRNDLRWVTGLLTWLYRIRVYLRAMELDLRPTCGFCDNENYYSEHILGALLYHRKKYLGAYQVLRRRRLSLNCWVHNRLFAKGERSTWVHTTWMIWRNCQGLSLPS